jgi:uncharacterized C2H2 Zn-finger protein
MTMAFQCHICDSDFEVQKEYNAHVKTKHPESANVLVHDHKMPFAHIKFPFA